MNARASIRGVFDRPLTRVAVGLLVAAAMGEVSSADLEIKFKPIATGFSSPTQVTSAPNSSRLFVTERSGRIRVIQNGTVLATPFLDIQNLVNTGSGEYGFSTLAFDPNYALNGRFYVSYSDKTNNEMVVARYTVSADPNVAEPVGQVVYRTGVGIFRNIHMSGWLGFRPGEPSLYVGVGDNQSETAAASTSTPNGKILRLDVSGNGPAVGAAGNPFPANGSQATWAYGLRNPYRNSFDRQTGDLYVADVGNYTREEINVEKPSQGGRYYGWPVREGAGPNPDYVPGSVDPLPPVTEPVFSYDHSDPVLGYQGAGYNFAAAIGGYVYRGNRLPELKGTYLFGDFCSGAIASFKYDGVGGITDYATLSGQLNPGRSNFGYFSLVSFGEGADGEIYAANISNGTIYSLAAQSRWTSGASGSFTDPANWLNGDVPSGTFAAANFNSAAITGTVNCVVTAPLTLGTLRFAGPGSYRLAGSTTLTLAGGGKAVISVDSGNHQIELPTLLEAATTLDIAAGSLMFSGPVTGAATATLTKTGPGTVAFSTLNGPTLVVAAGTVVFDLTTPGASVVAGLTIANDGAVLGERKYAASIDIGASALVVRGASVADSAAKLQSLSDMVRAAIAGPTLFTGGGLTSSLAAADVLYGRYAVGVIQNNVDGVPLYDTFQGVTVGSADLLVRFTYFGHADLNGLIDDTDFFLINSGYANGLTGWINGDFDYSGVVDDTDYFLLNSAYALQGAAIPGVLPEPGPAIGALALLGLSRRRRL